VELVLPPGKWFFSFLEYSDWPWVSTSLQLKWNHVVVPSPPKEKVDRGLKLITNFHPLTLGFFQCVGGYKTGPPYFLLLQQPAQQPAISSPVGTSTPLNATILLENSRWKQPRTELMWPAERWSVFWFLVKICVIWMSVKLHVLDRCKEETTSCPHRSSNRETASL